MGPSDYFQHHKTCASTLVCKVENRGSEVRGYNSGKWKETWLIKEEQVNTVKSFMQGHDVFVSLPTGLGNPYTFAIIMHLTLFLVSIRVF